MADPVAAISGWERSLIAAEKVKDRVRRAAAALGQANVPYAVIGGNAVAEWVARVDEGAVRTTPDVDILIRRDDLPAAHAALAAAGFVDCETTAKLLDGPDARPSEAIHLLFAGEKARATDVAPMPDVSQSERAAQFQVATLQALVVTKLVSFRLKDRVHLRDMIGIGLIDQSWTSRLPPELAARLQELLDDPNG